MWKYKSMQAGRLLREHCLSCKFAEFYYHKIFETRSRWRLKTLQSPCGLSITGDVINVAWSKGNDVEWPINSYQRVAFTVQIW